MLNYHEIFVPGGFPRHTYNPRVDLRLESRLQEANNNLCKLAIVTGHTKSGKTVLARKVFPPEGTIWIDGGTISQEDDIWGIVLDRLALFQSTQEQTQSEKTSTISGKGMAEANLLVAKGQGEVGAALAKAHGEAVTSGRTLSPRVVALKGLRKSKTPLVIDDFHYLPTALQGSIVRTLKPRIFDGLPVVIIAIPHRRYDAMKVEREMTGRIYPIEIPVWSEDELSFIPKTGFELLGYQLPSQICKHLTREAIGSPHLMQDFCRTVCKRENIAPATAKETTLTVDEKNLEDTFREVAETVGRPIFEKLARGPRQRSDRVERKLKNGSTVDIYQLVLNALAHIKPGLVSLEYEDLRTAIREVAVSSIPQLHEVTRVLKHMATIAATDQSSTPVIDFEESEKKLHITDPFFAFYLRWGDISS